MIRHRHLKSVADSFSLYSITRKAVRKSIKPDEFFYWAALSV
jgi:hypothetical protein